MRVFHEFVKCNTILEVKSKLYARTNMFGVINGLGVLQYDLLEIDNPLRVPLLIFYTINLHWEGCDKFSPGFSRRCVVALGRQTDKLIPPSFSRTILCDSNIQMVSSILVHPILVDPKEHVVSSLEEDFWEVSCVR